MEGCIMFKQKGEVCTIFIIFTFMMAIILVPASQKIPEIIDYKIAMEKKSIDGSKQQLKRDENE